jgi:hypothetical protein
LVEQPLAPCRREGFAAAVDAAQEAEEPEAVVDRDDHHVAASGERSALAYRPRPGSKHKKAPPCSQISTSLRRSSTAGVQTLRDG